MPAEALGEQNNAEGDAIGNGIVPVARGSRLGQLVAGAEHMHARLAMNFHFGEVGSGGGDDRPFVQPSSRGQKDFAGLEIAAAATDVIDGSRGIVDDREAALAADIFLDDDSVRAGGHRRAGENAHAGAGFNRPLPAGRRRRTRR